MGKVGPGLLDYSEIRGVISGVLLRSRVTLGNTMYSVFQKS